jgi:ADP-heptose:LPS heptosyltransferase
MIFKKPPQYYKNYYCHNRLLGTMLSLIDRAGYCIFKNKSKKSIPKNIHNILLCRNDHLGDVIMLTPIISAIRDKLPNVEIDCIVSSASQPITKLIEGVSKFYFFDMFFINRAKQSLLKKIIKMLSQIPTLVFEIRKKKYDIAIDFRPHLGNMLFLLEVCNIQYIIGYKTAGFGFVCNKSINFDQEKHFIENMFDCIKDITSDIDYTKFPIRLSYNSTNKTTVFTKTFPQLNNCFVIHPFSGNLAKLWPIYKWNQIIEFLANNYNFPIVILGGKSEIILTKEIVFPKEAECYNLVGKTSFEDLISIVKECSLFIGLDSLLIHIAAAFNKECVIIHGGFENYIQWKPWLTKCTLLSHETNCSPCRLKNGCKKIQCINNVEVQEVCDAITNYI